MICPICEGKGTLVAPYDKDEWKPVYDSISGYYGYEYRSKRNGSLVLAKELSPVVIPCHNCDGIGHIYFTERL